VGDVEGVVAAVLLGVQLICDMTPCRWASGSPDVSKDETLK